MACIHPLFGTVKPRVLLANYEGVNYPVAKVIGKKPVIVVDGGEISLPAHQKFEMLPFGRFGNGAVAFVDYRESGDLKKPRSAILLNGSLKPDQPINDPYLVVYSDLGGGYAFQQLPDLKPQRTTAFDLEFRTGYGRSTYNIFLFSNGREVVTDRIKANPLDPLFSLDGEGDRAPKAILRVPPEYPINLRNSRLSGEAAVIIFVDKWGCATDTQLISATHDAFGEAALNAVRNWVFNPALKDGKPVPQKVKLSVPFTVKESGRKRR